MVNGEWFLNVGETLAVLWAWFWGDGALWYLVGAMAGSMLAVCLLPLFGRRKT